MSKVNSDKRMSQLPAWLWPNSNVLSPLYKKIWEAVQEDQSRPGALHGEVLVDTNKIFPLLLTSQLPTEVLGYIWSLANQKYAGQLTEQELYIVLALVALAQASYPFNSLEVLNYIRIPPTPNLSVSLLDSTSPIENEARTSSIVCNTRVVNKKHINSSRPVNKSSPNSESYNYSEFRDIKATNHTSAIGGKQNSPDLTKHQYSAESNDDFSDFQSAPITPVPTIPSIPNLMDSRQGSAIGSRLANHNLGVKKFNDKTKKTAICKSNNANNSQSRNVTCSVQHSRDVQPNERLSELFPKCAVKNQAKTVILKDTAIRNYDAVEAKPITNNFLNNSENSVITKIPPLPKSITSKSIQDSVSVIQSRDLKTDGQDLMNLQPSAEDRYSALRALVKEVQVPTLTLSKNEESAVASSPTDDFGDFVSAVEPQLTEFSVKTATDNPLNSLDLLSDLNFDLESTINKKSSRSLVQEISDAFDALASEDKSNRSSEGKFNTSLETEKVVPKEDTNSVNSIDLSPPGSLRRSESVPSLDFKSFLPSSQDDEQHESSMHQMIYWEWKQYMESCIVLLQVAANIFTSITSEMVLRQVLTSAQGYNFLCNLAEVAAVCRRVNFSHKEMDINIMGFDDLLMDIDRIWSEMEPFYANIPIVTELPAWPLHPGEGITCALCLTIITSGRVICNDNNYHVSCANLWLNTVNNNLPALRCPYLQPAITSSTNHV